MKSGNFNLKAFFSGNGFQGAVSGDVAKPATCYASQRGIDIASSSTQHASFPRQLFHKKRPS
ncbi:MAG: hypothetical protein HGA72_08180 [Chlorobiaceae bacterium]|nr:hypothetical protein [Chlorobiaceae bacterium]